MNKWLESVLQNTYIGWQFFSNWFSTGVISYLCYPLPSPWFQYTARPDVTIVQLTFLDFMMVWRQYALSRNHTTNFKFELFLGYQCELPYSVTLGSGSQLQLPVSHAITRVNNWYHTVYYVANIFRIIVFCVFTFHHVYKVPTWTLM